MAGSSTSPRLTILGGPLAGRELTLEEAVDNILVGSDPSCRFQVDLPGVSPIHARLWVDWQGVTVYDTGAPEGVYLNDDRVERSATVRNGDVIWLGRPGGAGVVMIQCRIPPRPGAAPRPGVSVTPATEAPAASAGAASAQDEAPGETVALDAGPRGAVAAAALVPDATGEPRLASADLDAGLEAPAETVWIPPEARIDDADAAPMARAAGEALEDAAVAASVEPPSEAGAETVVLHTDEPVPPAGFALLAEQPALEAEAPPAEEVVKFEIDEPPPEAPASPVFEEDIEEATAAAAVAPARAALPSAEPVVATEPPAPTVVVPPQPARPSAAVAADERRPQPLATPAPRPPARPAAPAAQPAPGPPARKKSAGGRTAVLAAGLVLALAAAAFVVPRFVSRPGPDAAPASPAATVAAPPVTTAQAPSPAALEPAAPTPAPSAPVEEAVTIVRTAPTPSGTPAAAPAPTPRPSPTPRPTPARAAPTPAPAAPEAARAQPAAAQVSALVAQAEGALGEHRYDAAASLYAQALQLDPQNPQATAGHAKALAGAAAARRSFVAGRSVLRGARSGRKGPAGFESEDVEVAKAPDYSGRLEFETSPRSLKPGDSYAVKVYLVNDGKKDFKIASLTAVTTTNGEKSGGPVAPAVREVGTQRRELVQELSGVWKDGTTAWSLEVAVASGHGEVVSNTLTWR